MVLQNLLSKIAYGGDYNPEQWPEEVWEEDMRLLKAAGVDTVTLNTFSWAMLQPEENRYDFSKLDKIMKLIKKHQLQVCMATSTGAHPAWMARKYPDILRTEFNGMKRKFGGRHNSCPNSPTYRHYAEKLAGMLADRYGEESNIFAWHISNEFGGECYCENCEQAFRSWLKKHYGTLEEVNRVWNTAFWGHTFYDWEEIVAPNLLSEHFAENRTMFQGISLDYRRFMSDSILECYCLEADAIRKVLPDAKITTNLMGCYKPLDYFKWAKKLDFVAWDNYPANEDSYAKIAMNHDVMRGIKQGEPFALMEQTPSVTNWLPYNALKRPGVMRLWSYQAVAHGADTVMFFQMRRSIGACEKYHGAVIDHVGTGNTRVYREVAQLGKELQKIGGRTLGMRTRSKIAILMDWDNWWAIEYSAGPSQELSYLRELQRYYEALREMNYNIDFISPEDEMRPYAVVLAPVYYMVKETCDEKIRRYVEEGGYFLTTFFSGYVQENDLVIPGGYPGKLRDILGIWVEEEDALPQGTKNFFRYDGEQYPAELLCDLLHPEGAEQIDQSGYEKDFYRGMPVLTCHKLGKGRAYYVATASDQTFYKKFLTDIAKSAGVEPELLAPQGVEVTTRENETEKAYFILNHMEQEVLLKIPAGGYDCITGQNMEQDRVTLAGRQVLILIYKK